MAEDEVGILKNPIHASLATNSSAENGLPYLAQLGFGVGLRRPGTVFRFVEHRRGGFTGNPAN